MAGEQAKAGTTAPITSAERIGELDILRGFALLGVLIANLVWFSFFDAVSTDAQREAFLANDLDRYSAIAVTWLVSDKANTLFAVLFGIGFWVQQERLRERGADFQRIYLRRLTVLLAFGFVNLLLIWPWDILQLYAIAGFLLFMLRGLSARTMLVLGIILAIIVTRPLTEYLFEVAGVSGPARDAVFSEPAVQARQAVFREGSYVEWVGEVWRLAWYDYIVSGILVAWIPYAFGRFLIGAWIARKGFLQRVDQIIPILWRIMLVALALGLSLEAVRTALEFKAVQLPTIVGDAAHALGAPVLALGYGAGVVLLSRSVRWRNLVAAFGPVGRMALTNYVLQGVYIGFLLYGFGPGLGLAGRLGPAAALALSLLFFGVQLIISAWWLWRFRFGPLEWAWRALTYGERPTFRQPLAV